MAPRSLSQTGLRVIMVMAMVIAMRAWIWSGGLDVGVANGGILLPRPAGGILILLYAPYVSRIRQPSLLSRDADKCDVKYMPQQN